MPTISRMNATLGSVMTARKREAQPDRRLSSTASLVARRCVLPACDLHHATVNLPEQVGRITRDEVDDVGLQWPLAERVAASRTALLGPLDIAAAQLGEAADEGDGVIG